MTIHAHVAEARGRLREAGLSPRESELGARLLAQHALGWTAERLLTSGGDETPAGFPAAYDALVARRARREPLAYITGTQEFWGLPFAVSSAVLIPRHETELVVEASLARFPDPRAAFVAADVGTGSGCLAVALAHERPAASITATDISPDALAVARHNARRNAADRIRFVQSDVLEGVAGPFDLIMANPPYVKDGDERGLQPEVGRHEPRVALYGGADGLDVLRRLLSQSAVRLRPTGWLIFEFGFGQDEWLEPLIDAHPRLRLAELRRDLQGIARTAVVERRP